MSTGVVGIKLLFNPVTVTASSSSSLCLQGQLGLGEDRIHISAPHLVGNSQLAQVARIQAGDSYSAAVTGEPGSPRPTRHPGLKGLSTLITSV